MFARFRGIGLLLALGIASSEMAGPAGVSEFPKTIVWAWDRAEDLRFLPPGVGVAFLADTVTISAGKVSERLRLEPVQISAGVPRLAVVRIETKPNSLTPEARSRVADSVLRSARLQGVSGIQIDFDTRRSERTWFRELLLEVRRKLPRQQTLSITALASWCEGDDWISSLAIDEAVPMLFRLGPERETFRRLAACDHEFREPLCRTSFGFSTDEVGLSSCGKRVYWFSPVPWTSALFSRTGESK
jgi:uncharacterized protein DUF3142